MRKSLATAAGVALLALTVAGCASTVPGNGSLDLAVAGPTAGPTSGPSDDPTSSPTDDPTASPGDDPTSSPSDDPTSSPSGSGDDGDGDRQTVADVTERWYHGLAARDGERVCGLMTAKAQASVSRGGGSCEDAVESTTLTSAQRDAMSRVQVDPEGVSVSGDSARVPASAVTVGGQRSTSSQAIQVARDGGDWKVDDVG